MLLVLLLVCRYYSAQGGCTPSPPGGLRVPSIPTDPYYWNPYNRKQRYTLILLEVLCFFSALRAQIGHHGTAKWTVYSATQVRVYGLWCQVRHTQVAGMGSNIGDWYYPTAGNTPDGFTLLQSTTDDNVPYQSLKCTNQTGLVVDGKVTSNQGIVKCNTTVPSLSREANYFAVYSDDVFNNYGKLIMAGTVNYHSCTHNSLHE